MTEEELRVVVKDHMYSHRGRCVCSEYLGNDPEAVANHLARKLYEAMHGIEPAHYDEIRNILNR